MAQGYSIAPGQGGLAAIYVRVSTSGQEQEGTSLQTQEEACRQYASDHGLSIDERLIYRETHSGSELYERKELNRLRESIRAERVDVLIAYAVDRLSRNQAHVYILADEMDRAGVRLEFVCESFEDTAVGKFIRSAKAFAAELELEKIKERTVRGKLAKVHNGRPLGQGKVPFGYRWRDEEKTAYEVDPAAEGVIRRIFEWATNGETLREIARILTQEGVPTPSGQAIPWRHNTVSDILSYPGYAGRCISWRWKTSKVNGKRQRTLRPEDEWVPAADGTMPLIVEPETWEAAQRMLEANRDRAGRKPTYPDSHLLRGGFILCGSCGRPMQAAWNGKDHKPKYVCGHARGGQQSCPEGPSIHGNIIDTAVWQVVERILLQPELIAGEFTRMRSSDPVTHDLDAVERSLSAMVKKQGRLIDALADAEADLADAIKVKLSSLSETKRQLQQERERLLAYRAEWQALQTNLNNLENWCRQVASRLKGLDFESRQLALRALGVKVRVWRRGHEPRFEIVTNLPTESVKLSSTSRCCPRPAGRG